MKELNKIIKELKESFVLNMTSYETLELAMKVQRNLIIKENDRAIKESINILK